MTTEQPTRPPSPLPQNARWASPYPLGSYRSLRSGGTFAAPLLAGFSFTITAVLLSASQQFARWTDVALGLLVGAGLVLIFAVQAGLWLERYDVRPSEFAEWFPQDFDEHGVPDQFVFGLHQYHSDKARVWAITSVRLYNVGIVLILAGVMVTLVPPGHISAERWFPLVVAGVGLAAEVGWTGFNLFQSIIRAARSATRTRTTNDA